MQATDAGGEIRQPGAADGQRVTPAGPDQ